MGYPTESSHPRPSERPREGGGTVGVPMGLSPSMYTCLERPPWCEAHNIALAKAFRRPRCIRRDVLTLSRYARTPYRLICYLTGISRVISFDDMSLRMFRDTYVSSEIFRFHVVCIHGCLWMYVSLSVETGIRSVRHVRIHTYVYIRMSICIDLSAWVSL